LRFGCGIVNKNRSFALIVKQIREFIFGREFASKARMSGGNFTRNRSLPLPLLCMMILRNIRQALQLEIDDFFKSVRKRESPVSKQAFSKARTGLNPSVIKELFSVITRSMCRPKDLEYYKRYRLCAMDGSDVALYNSKELKDEFGCSGGSEKAVTAMASIAYDPLNNVILDASLNHCATDERVTAKEHIINILRLPIKLRHKILFIMDRGYPSREFLAWLLDGKHKFIMRVRRKFNLDFDSVSKDGKVTFDCGNRIYRVRIIKVALDSGESETLITNLDEKELPYSDAADQYFRRWAIETKFNSLKNKLELENMSGRRVVTVKQDFWASLFLANMCASLEWQTNAAIEEETVDSNNKYVQTTNENRLIHKLRESFFDCLLEPNPAKRDKLFSALVDDIACRPEDVKPNRSFPRNNPRNMRFHDTYKSVT
jgi:hypothetical protein